MSGDRRHPALRRVFLLSGGGNDFIALLAEEGRPSPEEVRRLCRRGLSLGADGLLLLARDENGVGMSYHTRDGSPAALCLNGARCAAELAFHLGWGKGTLEVAAAGAPPLVATRPGPHTIALQVPVPAAPPRKVALPLGEETVEGWRVDTGVPHLVVWWPGPVSEAPLARLGPSLRHHPALGTAGTNVDLVRIPERGRLEIRSYERGVEGETLACGTGVLAAVAVGLAEGRLALPVTADTAGGFSFLVDGRVQDGQLASWSLVGDARLLLQGELLPGSLVSPN